MSSEQGQPGDKLIFEEDEYGRRFFCATEKTLAAVWDNANKHAKWEASRGSGSTATYDWTQGTMMIYHSENTQQASQDLTEGEQTRHPCQTIMCGYNQSLDSALAQRDISELFKVYHVYVGPKPAVPGGQSDGALISGRVANSYSSWKTGVLTRSEGGKSTGGPDASVAIQAGPSPFAASHETQAVRGGEPGGSIDNGAERDRATIAKKRIDYYSLLFGGNN